MTVLSILLGSLGLQVIHHDCEYCGHGRIEVSLELAQDHEHSCCDTIHHCCSVDSGINSFCASGDCCPSSLMRLSGLFVSGFQDVLKKLVEPSVIDYKSFHPDFVLDATLSTDRALRHDLLASLVLKTPTFDTPPADCSMLSVFRC